MANQPTSSQQIGGGKSVGSIVANYLADYEGKTGGSSIDVGEGGVRLPDQPCKYAMISNWNVLNDAAAFSFHAPSADNLYENSGFEMYYGFNGIYVAQIFPGSNTGLLPVNNLKQICLRTRPGSVLTAWFAWFY